MIAQIAFTKIFGLPLIAYGGMTTFLLFLFAATIQMLPRWGYYKIPLTWHSKVAWTALVLGLVHGLLGLLSYLGL
jgi:hypothetical protein